MATQTYRFRPGAARHQIVIEQRDDGAIDDFGDPQDGPNLWSEFASTWASVEPLNGRELLNARQVSPEVTHRVVMRQLDGVTSKMRVRLKANNRILEPIEPPRDLEERNRTVVFMAKEVL